MSYEHEIDIRFVNPLADGIAKVHREIMDHLKRELAVAQERQAKAFKSHVNGRSYNIEYWVYLNRKNIRINRPCKKLDWKLIGPFQIMERYGKNAYRLDIPVNFRFHDVFHVAQLEKDFSEGELDSTIINTDVSSSPLVLDI